MYNNNKRQHKKHKISKNKENPGCALTHPLPKTFNMISNWKNPLVAMVYAKIISAL